MNWMIEIDREEFGRLGGIYNLELRRTVGPDGNWRYYKPEPVVDWGVRALSAMQAEWFRRYQGARVTVQKPSA